jgi:type VI protein secretion system component VasK
MRSLLREQLVLAGRLLALVAVTFGALPLVFHLWPTLAEVQVLRVPLAWLLLGFLAYPWLVLLGWVYVRAAEANEDDFADLLADDPEPGDEP